MAGRAVPFYTLRTIMKNISVAFIVLLICSGSWAAITARNFDDAEQERRYVSLIKELRCLVCQNQNLADSNAELATDLRDKVYEMIKAGSSDTQIVEFMVDRYGDFVLYRPPVNLSTIFLWVGPFIILLVCLWVLIRIARRRKKGSALQPDREQHERAQRLLRED